MVTIVLVDITEAVFCIPVCCWARAAALRHFSSVVVNGYEQPISPMNPHLTPPLPSIPSLISPTRVSDIWQSIRKKKLKSLSEKDCVIENSAHFFHCQIAIFRRSHYCEEIIRMQLYSWSENDYNYASVSARWWYVSFMPIATRIDDKILAMVLDLLPLSS